MHATTENLKVLGLIPARGGSKGIPGKNVRKIANKPLIQYTIDAAASSQLLTEFIVSTDSKEIAEVCRELGAAVPFMRPDDLASDSARAQNVAIHAIDLYDAARTFDYVLLLQPTAPFRIAEDIDAAIELATMHRCDSVVSFMRVETHHPYYMYFLEHGDDGRMAVKPAHDYRVGVPRQEFPPAVYRNGAIYLTRIDYLRRTKSFVAPDVVPYMMPPERSINIDEPGDIDYAEYMLKKNRQ